MKKYYKISEISKLYGIGVDSLRYYERLGILNPRRDTNGYRLYNLKDIYKLNIIRDLRRLDFSMQQIKEYLDDQSLENTLELLHKEENLLRLKIKELEERRRLIKERITTLQYAQTIPAGEISVKELPRRLCVRLNKHITRDEEMDFVIQKLHQIHEDKIRSFGNQLIGAMLSDKDIKQGLSNVYTSVFFILEEETKKNPVSGSNTQKQDPYVPAQDFDFILPKGQYLSCFYRGGYEHNVEIIQKLHTYAAENNLTIIGAPFELYEIDNRDTIRPAEFLTEIQLQVR